MQLESKEPAAASESTSFSSSSDEDYRELETQENSDPDLASPVRFEVSDLTSFFTVGKAEVSKRLLTSLHRIVFVEAGLPASTPMDIFLDHFVALGLEGLPMHFLLENDGPVFQWLPLNTKSPFLFPKLGVGNSSGFGRKSKFQGRGQREATASRQVLRHHSAGQAPYGMPSSWEIGLDSLDGEIPFCNLTVEDLEEASAVMHEQWQLLGMSQTQLVLTPIALLLEAKE